MRFRFRRVICFLWRNIALAQSEMDDNISAQSNLFADVRGAVFFAVLIN